MGFPRLAGFAAAVCVATSAVWVTNAWATKPKLDPDACDALRLEQIKFRQSGVLDDMSHGAAWAKANLSADRLREIQHYLELDEQVEFGCRDSKLTAEAKRASEAAARIEINSDADPTAPVAKDPPKPGAAAVTPAKKPVAKKAAKKKVQKVKSTKTTKDKESRADPVQHSRAAAPSAGGQNSKEAAAEGASLPAFGAGAAEVLPWSSP